MARKPAGGNWVNGFFINSIFQVSVLSSSLENTFKVLSESDDAEIRLISEWYESEWKIPKINTFKRLKNLRQTGQEFQVVMYRGSQPVATAGLYNEVGILNKVPRLRIYKHWLALVYTIPGERRKGFGSELCHFLEEEVKRRKVRTIYLFTHTAEELYKKLQWEVLEHIPVDERNVAVMRKNLFD